MSTHAEAFGTAGSAPVWYHGSMGRGTAENKLKGKPDGTFLIRDSSSSDGDFVLSASESMRCSHYIIQRKGYKVYMIGEQKFTDLVDVIEFYKRHLLDTTTLSVPLPMEESLKSGVLARNILFEVKALYNFNARDPEDLSFRKGDIMNVLEMHEEQWWKAQNTKTLQIGVIPANYVKKTKTEEPPKPALPIDDKPRKPLQRTNSVMDPALPPPRAAAADPPARPPARRAVPVPDEPVPAVPAQPPRQAARAPAPQPAAAAAPPKPRLDDDVVIPKALRRALERNTELPDRPSFTVCRAILDRVANAYDNSALSFKVDDVIQVTKQNENGLWEGTIVNGDGKVGHFPFTLVELMDCDEYDAELNKQAAKFEAHMDEIYGCVPKAK